MRQEKHSFMRRFIHCCIDDLDFFLYFCPVKSVKMRQTLIFIAILLTVMLQAQVQIRHYGPKEGLNTGEVVQVVELPNGQILANTVGAFKLFDGTTFVPLACDVSRLYVLPAFGSYGHLWQGDSLLWLRDFYYVYCFDVREHIFRYDIEQRLSDNHVLQFAKGEIGGEQLPDRLQIGGQSLELMSWNGIFDQQRISGELHVSAVCKDRQGGTWIGTQGQNMFYIAPPRPQAQTFACPNGKAAQIICETPEGGLLVGTEDGLWLFDMVSHSFALLKSDSSALYHSVTTDRKGRLWISSQRGIDCYDKGFLRHYDAGDIEGFLHDHVFFVRELPDGRLLACNNLHELGILDVEQGTFSSFNAKLPQLEKYRVLIDALPLNEENQVLVLTQNGAFVFDSSEEKIEPLKNVPVGLSAKFNCAWMDETKRLWVGTQNGLAVITANSDSSCIVWNGCVRGVTTDGQGRLWISTSDGLSRINLHQLNGEHYICHFTTADGIPADGISERGLLVTENGILCLASTSGVTLFNTNFYDALRQTPSTVLVGLNVGGRDFPLNLSPMELGYKEGGLQLSFSALNYATSEHTHYRYRLRGLTDTWTYTDECKAVYTTLPHGRYVFEVQSAVLDAPWGKLLQKEIIVQPPFWLTWWAICSYIVMGIVLLYIITAWYLHRKRTALVAENDERVNQLFELREEARHQFAQSVKVSPKDIAVNSREEELLGKVITAIERNIGNSDYTVDKLAGDVCMSRASLYRAMQNMLGITPNDFLRNVRLKQAAQLLTETDFSISDISARVGFGTPRYFTLHFKKVFGVLPSEYRLNLAKNQNRKDEDI